MLLFFQAEGPPVSILTVSSVIEVEYILVL